MTPPSEEQKFGFFPDVPENPAVVIIRIPVQWAFENNMEGAAMMLGMMEIYKAQLDVVLQIKARHAEKNGILKAPAGAFVPEILK